MRRLIPIALLALLAIGLIWFFSNYERVPSREWIGPSGEALRNPFLATERLAQRMGHGTRQLRTLPDMDRLTPSAILLLPNGRQALDKRRIREIVSWVENGGRLIAAAELAGVPDPLLDELGVQRSMPQKPPKLAPFNLPGRSKPQTITFLDRMALEAPQGEVELRLGSREYTKLIILRRGKGTATVATSLAFASNGYINLADNVELVWHLVEASPARELQIYFRPERLSLWRFLKEHAAPVLAAGGALLALWLWRVAPRFGPVVPDAPPARRRLLDHLRASGRYYWSSGLRGRLVVAARDAALRHVARAQPDFAAAPSAERVSRLSALVPVTREEAERFITAGGAVRGADFIRVMHTAQRIHSALEKGNR